MKGQSSVEYALLVGGAVVFVTVIAYVIKSNIIS
ncbi:MAG: class III signal peptide-containing protein [Candidatus Micrarchaeia archaeon]